MMEHGELTYKIIGCAMEVHKHLGNELCRSIRFRNWFIDPFWG